MSNRLRVTIIFSLLLLITIVTGNLLTLLPSLASIQNWQGTTPLPHPKADARTVSYNDYLFTIGGKENSGPDNTVIATRILEDGGLGTWKEVSPLPVAVYAHAVVATNQFIFIIGGWDGNNARNEVWRTVIKSDGILGAWEKVAQYPLPIYLEDAAVNNHRLYVVGGTRWGKNESTDKIYSAAIDANGNLGNWREERSLPKALYRLTVTAHNNTLYVSGGYDGSQRSNTIYYARIDDQGRLGAWRTSAMTRRREYHGMVVHDGKLWLMGGRDGNGQPLSNVAVFPIEADGTLGIPSGGPTLPRPLYRFGAVTVPRNGADYIFLLGGLSSGNSDFRAEVYHSDIPPAPTPAPRLTLSITQSLSDSQLKYKLYLRKPPNTLFSNVIVTSTIPFSATLIEDSINAGGEHVTYHGQPLVRWRVNTMEDNDQLVLSYRMIPQSPVIVHSGAWVTWQDDLGGVESARTCPIWWQGESGSSWPENREASQCLWLPVNVFPTATPTPTPVTVTMKGAVFEAGSNTPISGFTSVVLASSDQASPGNLQTRINDCQTRDNGLFDCSIKMSCQSFYFVSVNPEKAWANYILNSIAIVPPPDGEVVEINDQRWVRFDRRNLCQDATLDGTLFFIQEAP